MQIDDYIHFIPYLLINIVFNHFGFPDGLDPDRIINYEAFLLLIIDPIHFQLSILQNRLKQHSVLFSEARYIFNEKESFMRMDQSVLFGLATLFDILTGWPIDKVLSLFQMFNHWIRHVIVSDHKYVQVFFLSKHFEGKTQQINILEDIKVIYHYMDIDLQL